METIEDLSADGIFVNVFLNDDTPKCKRNFVNLKHLAISKNSFASVQNQSKTTFDFCKRMPALETLDISKWEMLSYSSILILQTVTN